MQGLFFNFYSYKERTGLESFFNFLALHDDSTIKVSLITVNIPPKITLMNRLCER